MAPGWMNGKGPINAEYGPVGSAGRGRWQVLAQPTPSRTRRCVEREEQMAEQHRDGCSVATRYTRLFTSAVVLRKSVMAWRQEAQPYLGNRPSARGRRVGGLDQHLDSTASASFTLTSRTRDSGVFALLCFLFAQLPSNTLATVLRCGTAPLPRQIWTSRSASSWAV